jgi:hypothetical protein
MTSLGVCSPGVLLNMIKNLVSLCRCVCTLQYRCLSSVDSPSITLVDQTRCREGVFVGKEVLPFLRANDLFEMI